MKKVKSTENGGAKTNKFRVAAFLVALAAAVTAFTVGIVSLNAREDGWYLIEANPADDGTDYSAGQEFYYCFEGGSNEIRRQTRAVAAAYSRAAERAYKLFDSVGVYDGYVNLASVNQAAGEWVAVPRELYDALRTAYGLTGTAEFYSVFAGALHREWETLLYLTEPAETDPLNDPDETLRIAGITAALNAPDALSLSFRDATGEVMLTKSAEYLAAEASLELPPALDFGLLRDALSAQVIAQSLAEDGYARGLLTTHGGFIYALPGAGEMELKLLGFPEGTAEPLETLSYTGGTAIACCFALPDTEDAAGYYAVADGTGARYRSLHYDARTGECPDTVLSAYAVADGCDPADFASLACDALGLFLTGEPSPRENVRLRYTLKTEPGHMN